MQIVANRAGKGKTLTAKGVDGGYYAIKGFLYQFDKTLIEVLRNPRSTVFFENQQDINYENFVLQVKHKETQDYGHSKLRKPVEDLLEIFSQDKSKRVCLYCHFRDRAPKDWNLTLDELDCVVSNEAKARHPKPIRRKFCKNFTIRFSEDYEKQFKKTIALIKSSFKLQAGEAILYHSIFRSKLLERSLLPKTKRRVSQQDLRDFLKAADETLFWHAYSKYLNAAKYAKLIKAKHFTIREPNIENFERLFLVECDSDASQVDLIKIAGQLARKFCRKGKSPQPFISFRCLPEDKLADLKQELFDQGTTFFDGTHFHGDKFRLDEISRSHLHENTFSLKILPESEIVNVAAKVKLKEAFQFFIKEPFALTTKGKHLKVQVDSTEQILQMIT